MVGMPINIADILPSAAFTWYFLEVETVFSLFYKDVLISLT